MLQKLDRYGSFWEYLSQNQKDLILEGEYLAGFININHDRVFKDYSFLIFPFAKAYEGFLKQLFLDAKMISHLDYISDHLRLGKLLSPNLTIKLGDRSLYNKITEKAGKEIADKIWSTWKMGRNRIFHYFPHNLKAVSYEEAQANIRDIVMTMEDAYSKLKN